MALRVLIVDDEALMRAGLRLILESEPDIDVIGEASDGRAGVDAARTLRPDVVLMDIQMKLMDGLEATRRILAATTDVKVIIVTMFDYDEHVYDALRAGVSGFLLKDAPAGQLAAAVRAAAAGDAVLGPSVARRLIADVQRRSPVELARRAQLSRLTARELDVMRQVARGWSNAEIAEALSIAETTVKTHVSSILAKLELRDRAQIVVAAYESGLVGQ